MVEVLLGGVLSALTGFGLWLVLPRGIVLTRAERLVDRQGEPLYDTWTVTNSSALPIKLRSVTVTGPHLYDDATRSIAAVDLPAEDSWSAHAVELSFDDEVDEIRRQDWASPWAGQTVKPGDTLTAKVSLNRTLTIRYQRAGRFGMFERRDLTVDGGV